MEKADAILARFEALNPSLDERSRRLLAAAEAQAVGRGGVSLVSRVTGIARSTIGRGLAELREKTSPGAGRMRRPGGGRKRLTGQDATLCDDLRSLVEPTARGDPEAPLLWTARSLRNLTAALRGMGHEVGHNALK